MLKAKYKCQKCGHEFELEKPAQTSCNKCGHIYVDWLNYEEVLSEIYLIDEDFKNYRS